VIPFCLLLGRLRFLTPTAALLMGVCGLGTVLAWTRADRRNDMLAMVSPRLMRLLSGCGTT